MCKIGGSSRLLVCPRLRSSSTFSLEKGKTSWPVPSEESCEIDMALSEDKIGIAEKHSFQDLSDPFPSQIMRFRDRGIQ